MALKKPLQEPIHMFQEGENKRAYHYFKLYKKFNGNLSDFQRYLEDLWRKSGENLAKYFDAYDIRQGKPPSYNVLSKWHTNFEWKDRKQAYDDDNEIIIVSGIRKEYIDELTEDFHKTAEFKKLNLEAAINESENGSLSPNGAEARANANSKLQSDMRTSAGLDNGTTKVKADVNGELNIDSNVDVRHHSVAEDIILNPAYAELTRKLLEDVTNEEGTDSK